jgi:two-component system, chemotaxis family, CheB/CheR fusion protein
MGPPEREPQSLTDSPGRGGEPAGANHGFPVMGIGASAGGLEAFRKLLAALPADTGIAFVLIAHLDPTHESMMVDLLSRGTPMKVTQAAEGMAVERNCVYVIPPQAYLSVRDGRLRLSQPQTPHGARLPFDFFLNSLADAYRERAVCVILSGTGADGSTGLRAVSEKGGLVIAQDSAEAAYDGMPKSAIATGAVNLVLPVAQIPQALVRYARHSYVVPGLGPVPADEHNDQSLSEIIELLRARTSRNFNHYRRATLLRRIRRRMAAAGIEQIANYIGKLREDGNEIELLAKDFLIHVTSFFRDAAAFEGLAKTVIATLAQQAANQPIRVWVPGCSTGEEAYSLAMLFLEESAARRAVKLQIFASDVSAEALDFARNGVYPEAITADVSAERLQRFFTRQDQGYRVSRELREAIVFTDHDLLADPPFSRIDLVSCRNLLIYLQPEEQRKVLSLFHFALNDGRYLFLGASETIGQLTEFFEPVSSTLRIFRSIGHGRAREGAFPADLGELARALWPRMTGRPDRPIPNLAEIAQRSLLDIYAPATVVVDRNYRALYFWGPTDRYLRVAAGEPSRDVLAMLREGLASRFRAAVRQATQQHAPASIGGVRMKRNGDFVSVRISARPLQRDGEELVLVSFVDKLERKAVATVAVPEEASRVAQLEQELDDTRKELESTIRELEVSTQEMSAINEEALSINEEFQSTNEELETSKEELQSLNEELTTTNNQLQETLERQRRTSDDLQNILNSSDAATLFLDEHLRIRFFTPSTATLFNLIASDVGRPLADLANPFTGLDLIADAHAVLADLATVRREVQSASGAWYTYRASPYRTEDNRIEGVVVSLSEISAMKALEQESQAARAYAEAIIDTVRDPLIVLDEAMRVVSAGRSFYRLFGASPSDTVGRPLPETDAHHLDVPALRAFLDRVASTGGPERCEIEIDVPTLGKRVMIVGTEKIQDTGVGSKRTLLILNDITDHRRAREQLAEARRAADEANLAKSRFLAAVSHDLRQPLQTLTFLHGALSSEIKDAKAAELLGRAMVSLDGMAGMLNALLDINQIETGNIHPQTADFRVNDLLDRLASDFAPHAAARGLGWRVVRCGLAVRSDPPSWNRCCATCCRTRSVRLPAPQRQAEHRGVGYRCRYRRRGNSQDFRRVPQSRWAG